MLISDIMKTVNAELLTGNISDDLDIQYAFSADMMSDVLAYADNRMLLITGLSNPQTIRTAEMLDIRCILYVRGKRPDQSCLSLAEQNGITVLRSSLSMFNVCGLLYEAGIRGGVIKDGK